MNLERIIQLILRWNSVKKYDDKQSKLTMELVIEDYHQHIIIKLAEEEISSSKLENCLNDESIVIEVLKGVFEK